MTAISSPNYRWRVGEIEITRVLEFEAALFEPAATSSEASPEIIARHRNWLEPTLMDPASGLLVFAFHSTVIRTPRATILVDTCSGNDKERPHKLRYHRKNWPYLAISRPPVLCPRTWTMCYARICMPITSVGTRDLSAADGSPPSRTPATCSPAGSGSTGARLNCEPHTPAIHTMRTACYRSWTVARPSSSPRITPSTTVYGSSRGRGIDPATSASWCALSEHPWS